MSFPGGNLGGGGVGPNLPRGTGYGGTRGTGALLTQILVAFVTQYHREGLDQLAKDIKALQQQATNARAVEAKARADSLAFTKAQTETQAAYNKIIADSRATWADLLTAQKQAVAEEKVNGQVSAETQRVIQKTTAELATRGVISAREVALINNQLRLTQQGAQAEAAWKNATANRLAVEEQVTQQLTLQQELQDFGGRALASLRNIATAAIGATIGGAVIGAVLFDPMQQALEKLKQAFTDLLDPGAKARDVIADLGKEINGLVDKDTLTRLDAAQKFINGIEPPEARGLFDPQVLAQLAQLEKFKALKDLLDQYKNGLAGVGAEQNNLQQSTAKILVELDRLQGKLHERPAGTPTPLWAQDLTPVIGSINSARDSTIDWNYYLGQAGNLLGDLANPTLDAAAAAKEAADAYADLAQQARDAAINAAFDTQAAGIQAASDAKIAAAQATADSTIEHIRNTAQDAVDRIQSGAQSKIDALQKRIQGVGDRGPSARTNELAAAVERLNRAEQNRQFQSQLADIAEQKHLILLQQRLSLTDRQINLDDYQGKERLVAIDALLARMNAQNAAQDRFNKLLDIQYQINQGVRRQQGETIQDFINRRAQYYRGLLEQAADLKRQGPEDELKAEKERVQTTLELRDLETRRTELLRDRAHQAQLKRLQDELKASQEADRKAAQAEQERLRNRIEAIRRNSTDSIAEINRTRDADIASVTRTRDDYIKGQKARTEAQLAELKKQRDDALAWANAAEQAKYVAATNGAQNIQQLNEISGALAGTGFSQAYVEAQLRALGLHPGDPAWNSAISGFQNSLNAYQTSFDRLKWHGVGANFNGLIQPGGTHAEGGIIPLMNSMNLGGDIRVGEQGPEGGMMTSQGIAVLNNEIMGQLRERDNQRGMFNGATFNVTGTGDAYNDRYAMEQMIERVVRKVIN